jgi:excisionase family DNA binding protein
VTTENTARTPVHARTEYFPPRQKTGQAARYLGISRRYLAQLTTQGRVPFYRLGPRCTVYARADLDQFLADHRIDAGAVAGSR